MPAGPDTRDPSGQSPRERFVRLAERYRAIPVVREVLADLETPVAAYWKLRRGPWSFLLESVEGGEKQARYTLMGTEPRAVLSARGTRLVTERPGAAPSETTHAGPLGALGAVLDRYVGLEVAPGMSADDGDPVELPRFFGGLVGVIGYDAVRLIERIPDRHKSPTDESPELTFLETRLVLVWDNLKHRAMLVHVARVDEASGAGAAWDEAIAALDAAEARLSGPLPALPESPDPTPAEVYGAVDDRTYGALVERAREYIAAGDIIQVVLSRRFLQARRGLHPFLVYRALRGLNPSPYMFHIELGPRTLVGASPELLVRRSVGADATSVEVRPIAGTRPRGATPEEDLALEAELRADPKEIAEHVMLVDLGRNDVGRIAVPGSVHVVDRMVVERYSHVMHLVSGVTGTLRDGVGPAETLAATFPAGTLTGAPKIRAMQIIDELEKSRRGIYGGAVGTIGLDGTLDLAITIRTLVADDSTFAVQAGAGIVWDSDPAREADETHRKARAVLRAIDLARKQFHPRSRG
ncbi:MAG: anthranilate synthase component I family protein [Deltaproteobacteria bacterium]|nr:anthranilate synthase component I family protein [Deltaproteobacteria bacterium]